jgi:Cu/Ag efflux protein CusF
MLERMSSRHRVKDETNISKFKTGQEGMAKTFTEN